VTPRRRLGLVLACLAVAGCGSEEDVPEPIADEPRSSAEAAPPSTSVAVTGPADVLEVRCRADGTTVATPQVQPGRAGVQLRVVNETDGVRGIALRGNRGRDAGPLEAGATVESVAVLRPGATVVMCLDPAIDEEWTGPIPEPVSVEVVDPDGLWRDDHAACPHEGDWVSASMSTPPPPGVPYEALADELRRQAHLVPDDEVRVAGYPDQENPPLIAVRNGRVIVSATPEELPDGWGFGQLAGCESDGVIDLGEPSEPVPTPDIVEVRCTPGETTTSTILVAPGPAGVRLRVVNELGKPVLVEVQVNEVRQGELLAGTSRETVEPFPPGPVDVACYAASDPAPDMSSDDARVARFDVAYGHEEWVPDTLECSDGRRDVQEAALDEGDGRPREELPEALRRWLKLRPTDEVHPAGYPEQANAPLVAVRDGRVVARGTVIELDSGWAVESVEACTADVPL
jgi:hypothetical protein